MNYKFLIFLLLILQKNIFAQQWNASLKANLLFPNTNTAIAIGSVGSTQFVYTFGGLESGKTFANIHTKTCKYTVNTNTWNVESNVPDSLGKIASAASTIKNKIYISGGYHVFANGNEISSQRLHIFDVATNTYLADGALIPIPIDDHVQAIWRDSLLFLISGWSNVGNSNAVQLYNPSNNSWMQSTTMPSNGYPCFGASGTIVNDTIYYFGGAVSGSNFPISSFLRKGVINPQNPSQITWSTINLLPLVAYRSACVAMGQYVCFLGGSNKTYNYNGISYNGSGVCAPNAQCIFYNTKTNTWLVQNNLPIQADYRNVAKINDSTVLLVGGLDSFAAVSNATIQLQFQKALGIDFIENEFSFYPNPNKGELFLKNIDNLLGIQILTLSGEIVFSSKANTKILLPNNLADGQYYLQFQFEKTSVFKLLQVLH
jgi:N-acetylneuraminic acid mutarotase